MAKLFNRAKMTTATTGSGTVTLGSASNGFQTFAAAGVSSGDVVQYVIEEGANFEIGTGTYSSSGTSLTRSPTESSNSNNAITLAGQATVSITAVADDLNRLQHGGSDKVTVSSTGASVTGNLAVSGTVDGRNVASDGSKLDGIESGATADQTAAQIRAKVEAASDSNVFTDADHSKLNGIEANAKNDQTITAGSGLSGGGTGDVTLSHSDTSSQASVNGSGRTYIQDITLDTYGHVTGLATGTETVTNTNTNQLTTFQVEDGDGTEVTISHGKEWKFVEAGGININWTDVSNGSDGDPFDLSFNVSTSITAGSGLTGGGALSSNRTISHSDTSTQASVNNSSGTVIQDVTLDGFGHVTGLASVNLDGRYYTESEADGRYMKKNGDSHLDMNNYSITNLNDLSFNDPGPNEGVSWLGGNLWKIYESPNDLTTNSSGNLQFVQNTTRRMTLDTSGNMYLGTNRVFADNYHPNADKWTTARTLSLTGDVTGSVSWDGSGNASLSTTVGNDSHTHSNYITSNADDNVSAHTEWQDDKQIRLGNSADFRMYHASSNGHTYFQNVHHGKNTYFQNEDAEGTNHAMIYMRGDTSNPYLQLFQNGSERLRTLSGGVGVTGLTVGDVAANPHNAGGLQVSNTNNEKIVLSGSVNPYIRFQENTTDRAYIQWSSSTDALLFRNQQTDNFDFMPDAATGAVNLRLRGSDNDTWGSVYADDNSNVGRIGFLDDDQNWAYRITSDVSHEWLINNTVEMSLSTSTLDMKNNAIDNVNQINIGSEVILSESTDRADLLQITSATSSWGGLQIRNSSNEGRWSFMTNGSQAGLYDDENNEWSVLMNENGSVSLYHNNVVNLTTGATYLEMGRHLDLNNYDIYGCDQIFHHGDTNTYMQFHAADQWRVVVGGSERLEVKNSSPHVLVSGDLNSTSDERLKKNIKPIDNALTDICQLEGVTFDWKDTGTQGQGFIAQQVEPIIPDVVNTDEDTGMKSINYVGLIGHLVEAIKEQQTQIDDLKAEIQSMKS